MSYRHNLLVYNVRIRRKERECFKKVHNTNRSTGPEVIKNSCSTQLSMKVFLINVKMSTIVGILTLISRKTSILCLSEPKMLFFLHL